MLQPAVRRLANGWHVMEQKQGYLLWPGVSRVSSAC